MTFMSGWRLHNNMTVKQVGAAIYILVFSLLVKILGVWYHGTWLSGWVGSVAWLSVWDVSLVPVACSGGWLELVR